MSAPTRRPFIEQSMTFFYTDDLERLSRFYREVLELPLVLDQGVCHIYRVSESSFAGPLAAAGLKGDRT